MRLALAGIAALGLVACTPAPDGVERDQIALFEYAVAAQGCRIRTAQQYHTVGFEAGISREQAIAIAGYELAADRAQQLEDGTLVLTEGPCAPGAEDAPRMLEIGEAET